MMNSIALLFLFPIMHNLCIWLVEQEEGACV